MSQGQALPATERASAAASAGRRPPGNSGSGTVPAANHDGTKVKDLLEENAVVIFAMDGCCMCHVIKLLLHGHGVSPAIRMVNEKDEADVMKKLSRFLRRRGGGGVLPQFPAVFVGGELFGGLDEIMGAHISGELVPKLIAARALWL